VPTPTTPEPALASDRCAADDLAPAATARPHERLDLHDLAATWLPLPDPSVERLATHIRLAIVVVLTLACLAIIAFA
jgi:hypothetical protein